MCIGYLFPLNLCIWMLQHFMLANIDFSLHSLIYQHRMMHMFSAIFHLDSCLWTQRLMTHRLWLRL